MSLRKFFVKACIKAMVIALSAVAMILLLRGGAGRALNLLAWADRTGFGVERILREDPVRMIPLLLFLALMLLILIVCISFIVDTFKIPKTPLEDRGDLKPRETPEGRADRVPTETPVSQPLPEGTDMEKYLRQLDDQLKSGLIDRAEYRALREKYDRMAREQNGR